MAEDSDLKIKTETYKGKSCYVVEYQDQKRYIEKSTGILLGAYSTNVLTIETEYSIGTVTKDDLNFDFMGYKLIDE